MAKIINRKVTIYINGKEVENAMKGLHAELKRLENEQRNATIGTEEYIAATAKIEELKKYIKDHTGSVKEVEKGWADTAESLARYSNILMGVQSAFQVIDIGVGKLTNIYEGFSDTLEGKNLEEKMLAIGSAVNRFKILMEILPLEAKIDIY